MTNDSSFQARQRAHILIELRRYAEAEKLLGEHLARSPQDAYAHALMGIALCNLTGRYEDALREARAAIHCDPNLAEGFYILGIVQSGVHPAVAQEALENALRLDPRDARFYIALGRLHLRHNRPQQALDMALAGRKVAPTNVSCANLQAVALLRLGHGKEAAAVAREALSLDPENAQAHAQRGWSLLVDAQPELARLSFAQALRIDPRLENAREGLVESLKARWPLYALALRGLLWLGTHREGKAGWALLAVVFLPPLLGLVLIGRYPLLGAVLLSWFALFFALGVLARLSSPFFDLLLRFDPYARLTLSRAQRIRTNWVIAGPIIFILTVLVMILSGSTALAGIVLFVLLVITRVVLGAANPEERHDPMRPL